MRRDTDDSGSDQREEGGVMTSVHQIRAVGRRGAIGVSLLAMALASQAQAQTSGTADRSDIVVTATATTATKTDTPILRVPQAIEIVTAEAIQDRSVPTIRQALQYTSGCTNASAAPRGDCILTPTQ